MRTCVCVNAHMLLLSGIHISTTVQVWRSEENSSELDVLLPCGLQGLNWVSQAGAFTYCSSLPLLDGPWGRKTAHLKCLLLK